MGAEMNKDMENTFNRMAELGGSDERLGRNTGPVINAPLRHKTPKPCGGCGATSERERCIGCLHDFGTQESAWVSARPVPAATDTGLVTVGKVDKYPHGTYFSQDIPEGSSLCLRSQAVELLAGRDTVIEMQADSIDKLEWKVQHWQDKHATLEADNAALTARVKELEDYAREATKAITGLTGGGSENFGKEIGDVFTADLPYCVERIRERYVSKVEVKRLEAKLAAAEKALEPFAYIAGEPWADENGWTDAACQNDRIVDWFGPSAFRAARAVLGGKTS